MSHHTEGLCRIDGVDCYRILDTHLMEPFLLTVVSPEEHWMYISSRGGLSAGRVNAQHCLFPYRTDDLLHAVDAFSGPWTGVRVGHELWEPSRAVRVSKCAGIWPRVCWGTGSFLNPIMKDWDWWPARGGPSAMSMALFEPFLWKHPASMLAKSRSWML